jgi:hypothetical protein
VRTYARIASGAVAELLATDQDITHLFHPALHWVDVTGRQVEVGWIMQDSGFAPPPLAPPQPAQPTLALAGPAQRTRCPRGRARAARVRRLTHVQHD